MHVGGAALISRASAAHALAIAAAIAILRLDPVSAAEPTERPRDAAEAVKEGDVAQWLKYYERERATQPPNPPAAQGGETAPAIPAAPEEPDAKR